MSEGIKSGDRIRIAHGMRIDVTDYHGKKPRDRDKDPIPFGRGENVVAQPRAKRRAYVFEGVDLVEHKQKKAPSFVQGVAVVGKHISAERAQRAVDVGHAVLLESKPKAEKAAASDDGAS